MTNYVILYRDEHVMCPADAPFGFLCSADDTDHAEEQCENANPGCGIVWAWVGVSYPDALDDYYYYYLPEQA